MNEIEKAIKLLKENNYFVKKITKRNLDDFERCEKQKYGCNCECCSCDICIME